MSFVALISHQCELISIADHFVNSPQVTPLSCASLFALTITVLPIRVESIHRISQLTNADFPIPRPLETAARRVSISNCPRFAAM
jgi:hypothetical protein